MKLRLTSRVRGPSQRGQALIEFAVVLPILILLLLLAVDFGRVFFGWVAINNASRIGANMAAKNPEPWSEGDTDDVYYTQIAHDLAALNCDADTNDDGTLDENDLPAPVFSDNADDPADPYQVGDNVTVTLSCDFGFLTPLVGSIVGDPMTITATTTFAVFGREILGIPAAEDPEAAGCLGTEAEVPNLVGMGVATARQAWLDAGFTGPFDPDVEFDDDTVLTQSTSPSAAVGDCLAQTASVSVTHKAPDGCTGTDIAVPNLVGMTVADARDTWTNLYTGGFTPLTGSDSDIVTSQTTNPSTPVGECAPITTQVNVGHTTPPPDPGSNCEMPELLSLTPSQALSAYQGQGFTGTFSSTPNDKPTWVVKTQSLIGGGFYACTANVEVQLRKP
jgi:Flp pilus assembly protein TadG